MTGTKYDCLREFNAPVIFFAPYQNSYFNKDRIFDPVPYENMNRTTLLNITSSQILKLEFTIRFLENYGFMEYYFLLEPASNTLRIMPFIIKTISSSFTGMKIIFRSIGVK